jgi:hypothetical protein
MDGKGLLTSKTFWANILAMAAMYVQGHYGFVIEADDQTKILGVLNLGLRFFTKEKIKGLW